MEKNVEQGETKQLGGITGRGFLPGQSGNPSGRPRTRGLIVALRAKVAEIGKDGRSIEEKLVAVLVDEALRGKHRLAAVELILDRLEGRARQQIEVADITQEIRAKSSAELRFYLEHYRWPSDDELATLRDSSAVALELEHDENRIAVIGDGSQKERDQ